MTPPFLLEGSRGHALRACQARRARTNTYYTDYTVSATGIQGRAIQKARERAFFRRCAHEFAPKPQTDFSSEGRIAFAMHLSSGFYAILKAFIIAIQ